MAKFKDQNGSEWNVVVSPYERDEVLEITSVDLYDIVDDEKSAELLTRFEGDDDFLRNVMWGICKEQCDKQNTDERGFKRHIYGQSLNEALEALLKAYAVFFRSPVERAMVEKLLVSMQTLAAKHEEAGTLAGLRFDVMIAEEAEKLDVESLVENSMKSVGQHSPQPASSGSGQTRKVGDSQPVS